MKNTRRERGVAAIEFAVVAPLLILILIGVIEFSRAWFVQASIAGAAREGARAYAISNNSAAATDAAINATTTDIALTPAMIYVSPTLANGGCMSGRTAMVTITASLPTLTGLFSDELALTVQGVYACQG